MIALNKPYNPDLTKLTKYLEQVNNSGWYTNFGPLHQELTNRLEKYLGVKNLLLVSNGTLALQIAYKTLNIKHALTTPFSFVATSSSLMWDGIQVSYSDIDELSCNLSYRKAKQALVKDNSIDSIVATHVYGNPCEVKKFEKLQNDLGLKIIYDAAHAFGVNVNNNSVLNYGDASTLSFHATKLFHTIEGGAVIFKNKNDYDRAKKLINFGNSENGLISEVGINAKLNEYQCAVGLTVLDEIEKIQVHRSKLFQIYCEELKGYVKIPDWNNEATINGSYMPIIFSSSQELNNIKQILNAHQINTRKYFSPSLDTLFKDKDVCKVSRDISERILCLPLHFYLKEEDVKQVVDTIKCNLI